MCFKEHLTQLYIENNIKPLSAFCQKHGLTLRYQTSYGKSLDVAETAMYPDIPETESLYGNDYMDFYRLQAGAVHAMDKEIYSMETSAEWTETWNPKKDDGNYGTRGNGELNSGNYEQTFLDHIWHDQRAFATGVNQIVFHGYPYNGNYDGDVVEGTQWPGFTGFESYRWSNSWGERQPNWMFAKTYMDFIARNQYILRQGTPKSDVAVYHHSYYETIDFWGPDKILTTEELEQNGYSYDFVDPSALSKENMTVEEGILDPEGTAYKALVFDNATDIPYAVATRLNEYADNGLKIVFIGEVPTEKSFVKDEDIVHVSADKPVAICPFAQTDIMKSLLTGVNPGFNNVACERGSQMYMEFDRMLQESVCGEELDEEFSGILQEVKCLDLYHSFERFDKKLMGQSSKQWLKTLRDYDLQDMAQLAENLIAMTSLERHMTFSEEGVGGPIDLAIITKNNGFTWLSRKSWYHHVDVGGRYGKFGV